MKTKRYTVLDYVFYSMMIGLMLQLVVYGSLFAVDCAKNREPSGQGACNVPPDVRCPIGTYSVTYTLLGVIEIGSEKDCDGTLHTKYQYPIDPNTLEDTSPYFSTAVSTGSYAKVVFPPAVCYTIKPCTQDYVEGPLLGPFGVVIPGFFVRTYTCMGDWLAPETYGYQDSWTSATQLECEGA